MKNKKAKILIVKLGAIGDIVMALSMLKVVQTKYPDNEITWICGKIVAPILKSYSEINNLIVVDEKKILTGNIFSRLFAISGLWSKLLFNSYDLVVVPYFDKRYKTLVWPVFKGIYRSFNNSDRLNTCVSGRYFANEFAKMIDENDNWQMQKPEIPKLRISDNRILNGLNLDSNKKKIVLIPGGAKNLINPDNVRRWPIDNYIELTKKLIELNYEVILAGSKDDEWVLQSFKGLNVVNLINKTSLLDLISLYNYCDLLITHDTGPLHLAKVSNIKALGLFGPTNPFSFNDRNDKNIEIIWGGNNLYCSPCYNGKSFAECDNNICMKQIKVDFVVNKINEILNG